MLIGIFGDLGSFKTSLMTALVRDAVGLGLPCWVNYMVYMDGCKVLDVGEILGLKVDSGLVAIDEIWSLAESRVSSSKLNRFFSYFIFQSRKLGVDVVYTSQLDSAVDLRIFLLSSLKVVCRGEVDGVVGFDFVYQGRVISKGIRVEWFENYVWGLFDTLETIDPLALSDLLVEVNRYDVEKINRMVDEAADCVLKEVGFHGVRDVYRYRVEDVMLRLGIPQSLGGFVTNRIKSGLLDR